MNEQATFIFMLVRTMIALLIVCAIVYLLFRWLLPRLQQLQPPGKMMRVVDSLALGERQRVFIVEVAQRYFLVSASAGQAVTLISELNAADIAATEEKLRADGLLRQSENLTPHGVSSKFSRILKKQLDSKGKS